MAKFKKGDYKVRCDISGFIVNASECRLRWDGLFVRKDLWSPRHPQDYTPPIKPEKVPPIVRPEGVDVFIEANDVRPEDYP